MLPSQPSNAGVTSVSLRELIALGTRAGRLAGRSPRTRDQRLGQQVSALRGRGVDYAESRVYQPGDDARNIDWRRTARSGKWHTKLFEEERGRAFVVMLDTHAGMRFGTRVRYKSVAATRVAALAVWAAVRAGDRVGALAFGAVHAQVAPRAGTRGAMRVLSALTGWCAPAEVDGGEAAAEEPLSVALARVRQVAAPGSRVLLLSDGWCADADSGRALAQVARRRDLRLLLVADALERAAPPAGAYTFETGNGRVALNLRAASARTAFAHALAAGSARLAAIASHAGVRTEVLDTACEPDAVLTRLWRRHGVAP